jgi:hypothetical protein
MLASSAHERGDSGGLLSTNVSSDEYDLMEVGSDGVLLSPCSLGVSAENSETTNLKDGHSLHPVSYYAIPCHHQASGRYSEVYLVWSRDKRLGLEY